MSEANQWIVLKLWKHQGVSYGVYYHRMRADWFMLTRRGQPVREQPFPNQRSAERYFVNEFEL